MIGILITLVLGFTIFGLIIYWAYKYTHEYDVSSRKPLHKLSRRELKRRYG